MQRYGVGNIILEMENAIPDGSPASAARASASSPRRRQAVDRALAGRRAGYEQEISRLIRAAFAEIRRSGRLEPRVGEIVRAAGLSNQAFYRHFGSKDELLLAVLDEGVAMLEATLARRIDAADSAEAAVRGWVEGILEQALDPEAAAATRPFAVSRARLAQQFPDDVAACEARLAALVVPVLERLRAEADGRDEETGAALASRDATALYDLSMGFVQRQLAHEAPASRADAAHLVQFALRALGLPS